MSDVWDAESTNLAFFQAFESELKVVSGHTTVIFAYGELEETPVTVNANYHGIHKTDDERWWLDATPLTSSIVDYTKRIDLLGAIQEHIDSQGLVTSDDLIDILQDDDMTMPAERIKTAYWLGHIIAPSFLTTGYERST